MLGGKRDLSWKRLSSSRTEIGRGGIGPEIAQRCFRPQKIFCPGLAHAVCAHGGQGLGRP
jgi:hypothetical protein